MTGCQRAVAVVTLIGTTVACSRSENAKASDSTSGTLATAASVVDSVAPSAAPAAAATAPPADVAAAGGSSLSAAPPKAAEYPVVSAPPTVSPSETVLTGTVVAGGLATAPITSHSGRGRQADDAGGRSGAGAAPAGRRDRVADGRSGA